MYKDEINNQELSEETLKQISEKVLKKVDLTMIFGPTNKKDNLTAAKKFDLFLKAINNLFLKDEYPVFINKVKPLYPGSEEKARAAIQTIRQQGIIITYTRKESVGKQFKVGDKIIRLPLEEITNPTSQLLPMIKLCYPHKFKWEKVEHLCAVFTEYLSEYNVAEQILNFLNGNMKQSQEKEFKEKVVKEYKCHILFETGTEPKDDERELYFNQMINDIKNTANVYGFGNCGLMADCAFLEVIYQNCPCPIHYVRFLNKDDSSIDVINTVVIGDWPNPGCFVISPWQDKRTYTWQSFEKTPALKFYNDHKVIFSLKPGTKEYQQFQEMLKKEDYENWNTLPARTQTLKEIRGYCENFKQSLIKNGFIENAEEIIQEDPEAECSRRITM